MRNQKKKYFQFTINTPAFTEEEEAELTALGQLQVRQKFVVACIQTGLKKLRVEVLSVTK